MPRPVRIAGAVLVLSPALQAALERAVTFPVGPSRMLTIAVCLVALVPPAWHALCRLSAGTPGRAARIATALLVPALGLAHLTAAAGVGDGPFGPVPGGPLRGPVADGPAPGWAAAIDARYAELEIRPDRPRSLETLVLVHGGDLYVAANLPEDKRWPAEVRADPRVRVRVDGRIHERRATWIPDPHETATLRDAMSRKYGFDVSLGGPIWFFRLDPR